MQVHGFSIELSTCWHWDDGAQKKERIQSDAKWNNLNVLGHLIEVDRKAAFFLLTHLMQRGELVRSQMSVECGYPKSANRLSLQ